MSATNPYDHVVLVDESDRQIGLADKRSAHEAPGQLHRALSGFVFDSTGRLIVQRRAEAKAHFALQWSNSFCTHPADQESISAAAERRVLEELGFHASMVEVGVFTYRATDPESGLVEHEIDHVVLGWCEQDPDPDPAEVAEVAKFTLDELMTDMAREPQRFTPWFAPALAIVTDHFLTSRTAPGPNPARRSAPQ